MYQYNGKELVEDNGLGWHSYGKRYYDAAICRFPNVDPLIDTFHFVTGYNYAENEPVAHIDLWGLQKYKPQMIQSNGPLEALRNAPHNLAEGAKTLLYEFVSPSNGQFMQEVGGNMENAGVALTATGVGASIGEPLIVVGGGLEVTGALVEVAGKKLHNGNIETKTAVNAAVKVVSTGINLPIGDLLKKHGVPDGASTTIGPVAEHVLKETTESVILDQVDE